MKSVFNKVLLVLIIVTAVLREEVVGLAADRGDQTLAGGSCSRDFHCATGLKCVGVQKHSATGKCQQTSYQLTGDEAVLEPRKLRTPDSKPKSTQKVLREDKERTSSAPSKDSE